MEALRQCCKGLVNEKCPMGCFYSRLCQRHTRLVTGCSPSSYFSTTFTSAPLLHYFTLHNFTVTLRRIIEKLASTHHLCSPIHRGLTFPRASLPSSHHLFFYSRLSTSFLPLNLDPALLFMACSNAIFLSSHQASIGLDGDFFENVIYCLVLQPVISRA